MKHAIQVQHLSKSFRFPVKDVSRGWLNNLLNPTEKVVEAVHDVSFTVMPGERVAFIGPNGAGKSTTIKMLTGIIQPTSGKVSVHGFTPQKDRMRLARHIGTVFGQRSQLFPNLPVVESLTFFGIMYGLSTERITARIAELTEQFGLAEFIDQPVRKLSLGQRMRAEVAASLIHEPDIIFLDEPTIGLDVVAKKSLRDALLHLHATKKTTIFLTSHDVSDIEVLCERTILINHGTLMLDTPTRRMAQELAYEKQITLTLEHVTGAYPPLLPGMTYHTQEPMRVVVRVDTRTCSIRDALHVVLDAFAVADIAVTDIDLEHIIRHLYEAAHTHEHPTDQ